MILFLKEVVGLYLSIIEHKTGTVSLPVRRRPRPSTILMRSAFLYVLHIFLLRRNLLPWPLIAICLLPTLMLFTTGLIRRTEEIRLQSSLTVVFSLIPTIPISRAILMSCGFGYRAH